jgi:penicillin-binding protein 2
MPRITIKDHSREGQLFTSRALFAAVSIGIIVFIIIIRLVYIQIYSHEMYSVLSQNNRVSLVPVDPTRGLIYDRNGVILAENRPAYSLEIVPEHIKKLEETLVLLGGKIQISARDLKRFRDRYKQRVRFQPVAIRDNLSDEEVAAIAIDLHKMPGVEIKAKLQRYYPFAGLTAHAVGYVGRISEKDEEKIDQANYAASSHMGKNGVEKAYENLLHGKVGYQNIETNAFGRMVRVLDRTPPTPGKHIVLTLDMRLQQIASDTMGPESGAVVAIDTTTGEVLALVSKGEYDPNLFVNGIDAETYKELQQSPSRPLYNRALQGQYPPGSTFKPFVALAGLELGEHTPDSSIFCRGWYSLKGDSRHYRDWKKEGHGNVSLDKAISQSCDVYFYDLAQSLGIDRMADFLQDFGFGRRTGIDVGGELKGILPSSAWKRKTMNQPWYGGETLSVGIGQGYNLVTPMQMAVATAIFANGGRPVQPHLLGQVKGMEKEDLTVHPEPMPSPVTIHNPDNWAAVTRGMISVFESPQGTAHRLAKPRTFQIAGKTGTAQVFGIAQNQKYIASEIVKELRDHALFIAFAPADKPKIAVGVIVENGGHGGSVAAPIATAIIDAYLEGYQP